MCAPTHSLALSLKEACRAVDCVLQQHRNRHGANTPRHWRDGARNSFALLKGAVTNQSANTHRQHGAMASVGAETPGQQLQPAGLSDHAMNKFPWLNPRHDLVVSVQSPVPRLLAGVVHWVGAHVNHNCTRLQPGALNTATGTAEHGAAQHSRTQRSSIGALSVQRLVLTAPSRILTLPNAAQALAWLQLRLQCASIHQQGTPCKPASHPASHPAAHPATFPHTQPLPLPNPP